MYLYLHTARLLHLSHLSCTSQAVCSICTTACPSVPSTSVYIIADSSHAPDDITRQERERQGRKKPWGGFRALLVRGKGAVVQGSPPFFSLSPLKSDFFTSKKILQLIVSQLSTPNFSLFLALVSLCKCKSLPLLVVVEAAVVVETRVYCNSTLSFQRYQ